MVLTYPDGRSAVVEAWTDTDRPYAEMQRHLRDSKGQFPRHWPVPGLGRVWALSVSPRTPFRGLTGVLLPILKRLETAGDTFQTVADLAELPTADRAKVADLEELGIVDISSAPTSPGEGAIRFSEPSIKGTLPAMRVDPETNAWIPVEASWEAFLTWITETLGASETGMRKHREKLAAMGLAERHLFLGVTAATPDPYFSLVDQTGVPSEPPTLPAEITHVWIMDCEADPLSRLVPGPRVVRSKHRLGGGRPRAGGVRVRPQRRSDRSDGRVGDAGIAGHADPRTGTRSFKASG